METKVHGHHILAAIGISWVAIALYQANVLGLPALVKSLVGTVLNAAAPITSSVNVGNVLGTGQ